MKFFTSHIQAARHTALSNRWQQRARRPVNVHALKSGLYLMLVPLAACMDSSEPQNTAAEAEILSVVLAQAQGELVDFRGRSIPVHPRVVRVDPASGPLPGVSPADYEAAGSDAVNRAVSLVPGYALCDVTDDLLCETVSTSGDFDLIALSDVIFENDFATVWLLAIDVGPGTYAARYYRGRVELSSGRWHVVSLEQAGSEN